MTILMRTMFTAAGVLALVGALGLIAAVWTGDARFGWSSLIVFALAVGALFVGAGLASTIEKRGGEITVFRGDGR